MSKTRAVAQLLGGLWLFGASIALLLRADLGLDPWDVLHQALAQRLDVRVGAVVIATSVVVLALWIPLRQRPGVGTVANVVLVGVALEATLAVLPSPTALGWRIGLLVAAILGNAVATGLYLGAGLGPGPRDGLMTGLAAHGVSLRLARTSIEATVLVAGWALGGTVGIGTVAYCLAIGPLAQVFIPRLSPHVPPGDPRHEAARHRRQHPPGPRGPGRRRLVRLADHA